jgi:hypothetical protein
VVEVPRRTVLRSLAAAAVVGAGGVAGASTRAVLSDRELFTAASAAGAVDLELAARTTGDGGTATQPPQSGPFPSTFADGDPLAVDFGTVDPDGGPASGSVTVALRSCENPARVWLRATGDPGALADHVDVVVSYANTCGGPRRTVFQGTLGGFRDAFAAGRPADAGCVRLGRVELDGGVLVGPRNSLAVSDIPGDLSFDGPNGTVTVTVTDAYFETEDGERELRGVALASSTALCRVDVKGGGKPRRPGGGGGNGGKNRKGNGNGGGDWGSGVVTYDLGRATSTDRLLAGRNPGGEPSALSNFDVYGCERGDCLGCEPACVTLDWTLADPAAAAGDSGTLALDFAATQCRYDTGGNPWA